MTFFFDQKQDEFINVIFEDNVDIFIKYYKKNMIIDNNKLIIFCAESGAYEILAYLFIEQKSEFNRLNQKEKIKLLDCLFKSKYFNNNYKFYAIINILLNNVKLNKVILNILLLYSLIYTKEDLINVLKNQKITLTNKNIKKLVLEVKDKTLSEKNKQIIISYLVELIVNNKCKNIYQFLSLSIGNGSNEICLESDIFDNLPKSNQNDWILYLMKANNLLFHSHQVFINGKKKDGYNVLDLNVDFLIFFNEKILGRIDIKYKDEIILNKLKKNLEKDKVFEGITEPLVKSLNIVLLNNKLKNNISKNKENKKGLVKI